MRSHLWVRRFALLPRPRHIVLLHPLPPRQRIQHDHAQPWLRALLMHRAVCNFTAFIAISPPEPCVWLARRPYTGLLRVTRMTSAAAGHPLHSPGDPCCGGELAHHPGALQVAAALLHRTTAPPTAPAKSMQSACSPALKQPCTVGIAKHDSSSRTSRWNPLVAAVIALPQLLLSSAPHKNRWRSAGLQQYVTTNLQHLAHCDTCWLRSGLHREPGHQQ